MSILYMDPDGNTHALDRHKLAAARTPMQRSLRFVAALRGDPDAYPPVEDFYLRRSGARADAAEEGEQTGEEEGGG